MAVTGFERETVMDEEGKATSVPIPAVRACWGVALKRDGVIDWQHCDGWIGNAGDGGDLSNVTEKWR